MDTMKGNIFFGNTTLLCFPFTKTHISLHCLVQESVSCQRVAVMWGHEGFVQGNWYGIYISDVPKTMAGIHQRRPRILYRLYQKNTLCLSTGGMLSEPKLHKQGLRSWNVYSFLWAGGLKVCLITSWTIVSAAIPLFIQFRTVQPLWKKVSSNCFHVYSLDDVEKHMKTVGVDIFPKWLYCSKFQSHWSQWSKPACLHFLFNISFSTAALLSLTFLRNWGLHSVPEYLKHSLLGFTIACPKPSLILLAR